MAKNPNRVTEDTPTEEIATPTTEPAPEPAKKTRKPRGANAPKLPAFSTADLSRFAAHIASDLKAARLDESVSDELVFDLFTLDKKLKVMIGGGDVA